MHVRRTEERDWHDVKRLRLAALSDSPDAFAATVREEASLPDAEWKSWAAPEGSATAFLAEDEGQVCGIVGVLRDERDASAASLISMWVESDHRRRGAGRGLVAAVIRCCAENDVSLLRLWVTASNLPAIALYESCGFARTGARHPLPSNPSLDEVEMSLRISG